jgi:hypothetical protein
VSITLATFAFGIGLLAGATLAFIASALLLRRALARTRAEILQSAALEARALGARIAALEAGMRSAAEPEA